VNRERGQALVESVVALPVCLACSLLLVDAGTIVRDRIALGQAAERAAEAAMVGADSEHAARSVLPRSLRDVTVDVDAKAVRISATSRTLVSRLAHLRVRQDSTVTLAAVEEAR
jgi:Flp pilus assembly protein TadG